MNELARFVPWSARERRYSLTLSDSLFIVLCQEGEAGGGRNVTTVCTDTGWVPDPEEMRCYRCAPPPDPRHGHWDCDLTADNTMVCLLQCQAGFTVSGAHIVECSGSEEGYQPDTRDSQCLRLPLVSPGMLELRSENNNSCLPPAPVPGGRWRCDRLTRTCVLDCHQGYQSPVPVVVQCCDGQHCLGWHSAAIGVGCTRNDCVVPGQRARKKLETVQFPLTNQDPSIGNESKENEDTSLENELQSGGRKSNTNQDPSLENEDPSLRDEDPSLENEFKLDQIESNENDLTSEGRDSNKNEDPSLENEDPSLRDEDTSLENVLPSEGRESNRDEDSSLENELKSEGEESNEYPGSSTHQDFESTLFPFRESDEDTLEHENGHMLPEEPESNKDHGSDDNNENDDDDDDNDTGNLREYDTFLEKDTSLENQLKSEGEESNENKDTSLENELKSEGRVSNKVRDSPLPNDLESHGKELDGNEDSILVNNDLESHGKESHGNEDSSLVSDLQSEGRDNNKDEDSPLQNDLESHGKESHGNEDSTLVSDLQSEGRDSNKDEDSPLQNDLESHGELDENEDSTLVNNNLESHGKESHGNKDPSLVNELKSEGNEDSSLQNEKNDSGMYNFLFN